MSNYETNPVGALQVIDQFFAFISVKIFLAAVFRILIQIQLGLWIRIRVPNPYQRRHK
jgi:hypothetical protein